jgi:hypothetical protein
VRCNLVLLPVSSLSSHTLFYSWLAALAEAERESRSAIPRTPSKTRVSAVAALLGEELIHDLLPTTEIGAPEALERIGQIDQMAMRCAT